MSSGAVCTASYGSTLAILTALISRPSIPQGRANGNKAPSPYSWRRNREPVLAKHTAGRSTAHLSQRHEVRCPINRGDGLRPRKRPRRCDCPSPDSDGSRHRGGNGQKVIERGEVSRCYDRDGIALSPVTMPVLFCWGEERSARFAHQGDHTNASSLFQEVTLAVQCKKNLVITSASSYTPRTSPGDGQSG
jgi:hypothetical protein